MKTEGHSGSLETWKKLWKENTDSLIENTDSLTENIEEMFEEEEEELESSIIVSESPDDDFEKQLRPISKEEQKYLEKSLDKILKDLQSERKKLPLPNTRSRKEKSEKVV